MRRRIDIISYGAERPVAEGDAEDAYSQNRRDEFAIIAGGDNLKVAGAVMRSIGDADATFLVLPLVLRAWRTAGDRRLFRDARGCPGPAG